MERWRVRGFTLLRFPLDSVASYSFLVEKTLTLFRCDSSFYLFIKHFCVPKTSGTSLVEVAVWVRFCGVSSVEVVDILID